ncbi:MAG: tRNA-specific 2-thiouridylase, partial [Clostridiales bacterium]|nr:tRNA-specific 2-thiouridylase [Clostridiales bacterium]
MVDRVLCAMSGGVDSSVAALLLQKAGFDVTGAMMRLLEGSGPALLSESEAEEVAKKLNIPFFVLNLAEDFKSCVIERFILEYERGRTPNPCVDCNRDIKFGALFKRADSLRCDYLATGHYARVERESDRWLLKKGVDVKKDQSYMLFSLTQDKLARAIFPLGGLTKRQVRELAHENGFSNAGKNDSQDICFLQ